MYNKSVSSTVTRRRSKTMETKTRITTKQNLHAKYIMTGPTTPPIAILASHIELNVSALLDASIPYATMAVSKIPVAIPFIDLKRNNSPIVTTDDCATCDVAKIRLSSIDVGNIAKDA